MIHNPRHLVQVITREPVPDGEGGYEYQQTGVHDIRCNVHPVSATDTEAFGIKPTDSYSITAPPGAWPGDEHALISWEGDTYTQRGRVLKRRMGRRTAHDKILMERNSG